MEFITSIKPSGFLSFPPNTEAIDLSPLNVLIGPNGSGKSNLIEAIELLRAVPTALADAIRTGGSAQEMIWKGIDSNKQAAIEVTVRGTKPIRDLRYRLAFTSSAHRTEVIDEAIEEATRRLPDKKDVLFFYRFQQGNPVLNVRMSRKPSDANTSKNPGAVSFSPRKLERASLAPDESVMSQRKDPDLYPEVTWLGQQFAKIQTFREWGFGRYTAIRQPQPADLPTDWLLPDARNLGLILNQLEHSDALDNFNRLMSRFLPRFKHFSTRVQGATVQFYLHENGLTSPIPAARLSDGTIRMMAILAVLLWPTPPPLLCIEEPELGLHPDAVSMLADIFIEASSRMQLIVTTHSDSLVSALTEEAGSVLVCENRGGTFFDRVEPERLKHWLGKYRLGEIWRIGELGGNP